MLLGQHSPSRGGLVVGLSLALDWRPQLSLMSALGRSRRVGSVAADAVGEVAPASFGVAQFAGRNRLLQATLIEEGSVGLEVGDGAFAVDVQDRVVGSSLANADAVQPAPAVVGEQLQPAVEALALVPVGVDAQHGAAVDGGVQETLDQGPGAAGVRRVGGRRVGVVAHGCLLRVGTVCNGNT